MFKEFSDYLIRQQLVLHRHKGVVKSTVPGTSGKWRSQIFTNQMEGRLRLSMGSGQKRVPGLSYTKVGRPDFAIDSSGSILTHHRRPIV